MSSVSRYEDTSLAVLVYHPNARPVRTKVNHRVPVWVRYQDNRPVVGDVGYFSQAQVVAPCEGIQSPLEILGTLHCLLWVDIAGTHEEISPRFGRAQQDAGVCARQCRP